MHTNQSLFFLFQNAVWSYRTSVFSVRFVKHDYGSQEWHRRFSVITFSCHPLVVSKSFLATPSPEIHFCSYVSGEFHEMRIITLSRSIIAGGTWRMVTISARIFARGAAVQRIRYGRSVACRWVRRWRGATLESYHGYGIRGGGGGGFAVEGFGRRGWYSGVWLHGWGGDDPRDLWTAVGSRRLRWRDFGRP